MDRQKWPDRIYLVRHGQSAGNVARDVAEAAGEHWIEVGARDVDTPLSTLGRSQAHALGDWFRSLPAEQRPDAFFASPYVRALETMDIALAAGAFPEDARVV